MPAKTKKYTKGSRMPTAMSGRAAGIDDQSGIASGHTMHSTASTNATTIMSQKRAPPSVSAQYKTGKQASREFYAVSA